MQSRRIIDLRRRRVGETTRSRPIRQAQKRETLRSRRRRIQCISFFGFVALAVVAVFGVSFASYIPQFSIERIDVHGAEVVRPQLVEAFVATRLWDGTPALLSESNVLLYPRAAIEAALKEFFPRIEDAKLSRSSLFANVIAVTIEERKPFGRWCLPATAPAYADASAGTSAQADSEAGGCFAMDRSGTIFAPASTTPKFETIYVFEGSLPAAAPPIAQTYLPGRLPAVLALLERLSQASFSPQRINVEGEQDFSIKLEEGFRLRVSFGADSSAVVKNLELVLGSEALRGKEADVEYIDLRFGNRVYYKFKGEKEISL